MPFFRIFLVARQERYPPEGPARSAGGQYVHSALLFATSLTRSVSFPCALYSPSQNHASCFGSIHHPQLYSGMVKTIPYIGGQIDAVRTPAVSATRKCVFALSVTATPCQLPQRGSLGTPPAIAVIQNCCATPLGALFSCWQFLPIYFHFLTFL